MNTLHTVLSTSALVVSLIAAFLAIKSAVAAQQTWQWVKNNNKKSVGLTQLTQLHTELTEHADSIGHLNKSLAKLRSRIGMRELRANGHDPDGIPDSLRDPEGYKRAMRLKIFKQGKQNGE
jgi:hypothetical protein